MTGDLDAAPLATQHALRIQHESAALDAANLLAVHVFHLDHAEQAADFLVFVGQQIERKAHLGLEVIVRLQAVARNADDFAAGLGELRMEVAEILALGGASGGVVLGVEVDDQQPGFRFGQPKCLAARRRQGEIADCFVEHRFAAHRFIEPESAIEIKRGFQ